MDDVNYYSEYVTEQAAELREGGQIYQGRMSSETYDLLREQGFSHFNITGDADGRIQVSIKHYDPEKGAPSGKSMGDRQEASMGEVPSTEVLHTEQEVALKTEQTCHSLVMHAGLSGLNYDNLDGYVNNPNPVQEVLIDHIAGIRGETPTLGELRVYADTLLRETQLKIDFLDVGKKGGSLFQGAFSVAGQNSGQVSIHKRMFENHLSLDQKIAFRDAFEAENAGLLEQDVQDIVNYTTDGLSDAGKRLELLNIFDAGKSLNYLDGHIQSVQIGAYTPDASYDSVKPSLCTDLFPDAVKLWGEYAQAASQYLTRDHQSSDTPKNEAHSDFDFER